MLLQKATAPKYPPLGVADRGAMAALLRAVDRIRDQTIRAAVVRALEANDVEGAIQIIRWDVGEDFLRAALPRAIRGAYELGGEQAARRLARSLSVTLRFDVVNPSSLRFIAGRSADLIREFGDSSRAAVRGTILRMFEDGIPPARAARIIMDSGIGLTLRQSTAVENFRRRLENDPNSDFTQADVDRKAGRYADRLLRMRAETIARTETILASREGQQESWRQAMAEGLLDPRTAVQEWIATRDDRVDEDCMELDGETAPLGSPFPHGGGYGPPLHPSCVPGDCLVSASGRIAAVSERWYEGDLVVVHTASGNELACTPNHPILTPAGWVASHLLNVGDDVIRHRVPDGAVSSDLHGQNVPALIHEIAEAFRRSGEVLPREVEVAPPDFHGDGLGSKVAVVWTDGPLWGRLNTAIREERGQVALALRRAGLAKFARLCGSALDFMRDLASSYGIVGSANLSRALVGWHPGPFQGLRFALAAGLDPGPAEPARDGRAGDLEVLGQSVHGVPGQVSRDQVVRLDRREFKGHVFNLQTERGWYSANSIIVQNCRCAVAILPDGPRS